MSQNPGRHLKTLKKILKNIDKKYLFPCIKALVTNGLDLTRFSNEDLSPSRQDITQYLLTWFKYIGISADECRDWMIEYCLDVLSVISSSSLSQIRHSTKSNIKYIYNSDVPFDCGCENNIFKAACERNCPVYNEMLDKYKERLEREANKKYEIERSEKDYRIIIEPPKLGEKYKDQFEKALEFVRCKIKEEIVPEDIVKMLNEQGFKTRMGKKWTCGILSIELKKNFNIEKKMYTAQFEKAFNIAYNLVKEGIAKKDIVNLLNERGFKTRTGRKWSSAILQNELKRIGESNQITTVGK